MPWKKCGTCGSAEKRCGGDFWSIQCHAQIAQECLGGRLQTIGGPECLNLSGVSTAFFSGLFAQVVGGSDCGRVMYGESVPEGHSWNMK
jgi:hypothetical protein